MTSGFMPNTMPGLPMAKPINDATRVERIAVIAAYRKNRAVPQNFSSSGMNIHSIAPSKISQMKSG